MGKVGDLWWNLAMPPFAVDYYAGTVLYKQYTYRMGRSGGKLLSVRFYFSHADRARRSRILVRDTYIAQ